MSDDITEFLAAKSDQLNADDLVGGPIVVRIEAVRVTGGEQPVTVAISGGHKPWKPCKTSMRVLSALWGSIASEWVGRTVRLFRDPAVRYGGVEVGGIRISGMSHIDAPKTVTLAASKKTKIAHRIDVLTPDRERKSDATPAQTEKPDPRRLLMSIVREFGATQMDIVNFLAERRGTDPIAVAEWDDALVVSVSKRLSSDDGAAQFRAWLDSTNSNPEEMPL